MRDLRERLRDERGPMARLRLWFDLVADAGLSLSREYRRAAPALAAVPAAAQRGIPLFQTLETELPKPGAFFFGAVMAFAAVAGLAFLLNHAGTVRQYGVRFGRYASSPYRGATAPQGGGAGTAGNGVSAMTPGQPIVWQPPPPPPVAQPLYSLDDAERRRILAAVAATLRQTYPDADAAQRIASALARNEDDGSYDGVTDGGLFGAYVSRRMQAVSGDRGLALIYMEMPMSSAPTVGPDHWISEHFLVRVPVARLAPASPPGA
jgi:hypothetical protein